MKKAYFRFYEELNDFLPESKRKTRFQHLFEGSPSVKDVVESMGVPHTEIDLILVNSTPVDFAYNIKEDDSVSVYPVFESFDISGVQHLRPAQLRESKFILDVHLGSLARYMRMCGFDCFYQNDLHEEAIIDISLDEHRTILTKNRNILKHNEVTHGHWVRGLTAEDQLNEVIRRFHLERDIKPFTRCMECNYLLQETAKEEVKDQVPQKVLNRQDEFRKCPHCGRIYWKGSHYEKMHNFIENLRKTFYI